MVDPGNRERGLKAAIHNPRVSEQAKQRDREILENEYGEGADPDYVPTTGGGTESSSHGMSSSASKMSKSKSTGSAPSSMTEESEETSGSSGMAGGKDPGNVIRGLKAAISNPNVSEEAKERDRQRLRELGGE